MNKHILPRAILVTTTLLLFSLLIASSHPTATRAAPTTPEYSGYLSRTVAALTTYRVTLTINNLLGQIPPSAKWYGPDGSQVSAGCIGGQTIREYEYSYGSLVEVKDHFYISSCDRDPGLYRVTVGADINRTLRIKPYYTYLPLVLTPPRVTPPDGFAKLTPIDSATGQVFDLTLDWQDSGGTDDYAYCYDTINDNTCTNWIETGTTSQASIGGLSPDTTYYWQARATNSLGTTYADGSSAAYWSFTTGDGSPSPFTKLSPVNGATDQYLGLTLDWGDSDRADTYAYCYDTTNDNVCTNWIETGTTSQVSISGLSPNTTYYWQARATNSLGTTYADGGSAAHWSFSTGSGVVNSEMIEIAAGNFQMGCDPDHNVDLSCYSRELPLHTVYLDAYHIDKYEVTNAQYAACVFAGACAAPSDVSSYTRPSYFDNPEYSDYPVIYVTWQDAYNYCVWAGKRLPTEAEWEKAARGTSLRTFPWGDDAPTCTLVNFSASYSTRCVGDTSPVGDYPTGASPYGVLDMSGNVAEMVNDWYAADYYEGSPTSNPTGPITGTHKVVRGGGYGNMGQDIVISGRTYDSRIHDAGSDHHGFRCAADPEP
jgi:formylglycine-generating enzyme required for sulfatase activity